MTEMVLDDFFRILDDGVACFTIPPYCEEYRGGIDGIKQERWYGEIKGRRVCRVVTIGGGAYPVETYIELEDVVNRNRGEAEHERKD